MNAEADGKDIATDVNGVIVTLGWGVVEYTWLAIVLRARHNNSPELRFLMAYQLGI